MANSIQITCINKDDRLNPYERITHIGTQNKKITQKQAIQNIKSGTERYHVGNGLLRTNVVVAISPHNHEYLRTENDGIASNNLLSLPECR